MTALLILLALFALLLLGVPVAFALGTVTDRAFTRVDFLAVGEEVRVGRYVLRRRRSRKHREGGAGQDNGCKFHGGSPVIRCCGE